MIPPALCALIHGARIYRFDVASFSLQLCASESELSLRARTCKPALRFGHDIFTNLMGPKPFDLPILLALAYVGMGYLSWVLSLEILECQDEPLSGKKIVLLPLAASFVMTAWDLSMDPVWADIDHAWVRRDGGSYDGVPITNFFGRFLTVYVFYQLFALYLRNRVSISSPTITGVSPSCLMPHLQRESPGCGPPFLWVESL